MSENIGFISTRFAGTDGVSLESAKWAQIFGEPEHHINFWYAGRLDRDPEASFCIPEAYFGHPENLWINERIWGQPRREPLVTRRIHDLAEYLKMTIYEFVEQYEITVLVIQNAISIPMHVPLGIAITEYLSETMMPAIAHHHDFFWERTRFLVNSVPDYLDLAFPPRGVNIQHAVINQSAQESLSYRKGLSSLLVPNVLDFDNPPPATDTYSSDVRENIGLQPDDVMILQPTRVVPRKGIEHSIKLIQMLDDPKYKLVVSHEAGDEGFEYRNILSEMAHEENIGIYFVSTKVGEIRQYDSEGKKIYTLWDLYRNADLVTYPSLYEGFGNAFLEAVYFRLPILVNRYSIFARDIEPKGFRVPVMEGYITRSVVEEVRHLLEDPDYRKETADHNYELAKRFFSYSVLREKLRILVGDLKGI